MHALLPTAGVEWLRRDRSLMGSRAAVLEDVG
jgi:hypothetical protein